jgi:ATP-dependent RNA helicase SUPV3L1/SUV3
VPAGEATAAAPAPGEAGGERKDGPNRQQRQDRHERQQRMERQAKSFEQKSAGAPGQSKPGQSNNGRPGGGPPRGDRPRREKGPQVDRAERDQYYAKPHGSSGGSDRNKVADPNSPFAKLAALKQQLEQGNKEST